MAKSKDVAARHAWRRDGHVDALGAARVKAAALPRQYFFGISPDRGVNRDNESPLHVGPRAIECERSAHAIVTCATEVDATRGCGDDQLIASQRRTGSR